jgi:hypothetical protein
VFPALVAAHQSPAEETNTVHNGGIASIGAVGECPPHGVRNLAGCLVDVFLTCVVQHSVYHNDFTAIARHMPGRSRESLREQWVERLSPHVKVVPWSPEEDELLFHAVQRFERIYC